ncbi:hypothetical protein BGZ94_007452 [Podila epigama]|nr:hypothetical protein BGZ94_007452 [Podila epigama]
MSQKVLQMPELVYRIGWFLPTRKTSVTLRKDVVSCIKVCRLWRDVLTPLLWMEFIDMNVHRTKIPEATFHANSKHIRYLDLVTSDSVNAPQITQLKGLRLRLFDKCLSEHIQLLNANPGLSSLVLSKSYDYRSLQADDIMVLLKPLTALQSLTLNGNLPLQPVVLKNVLDSNQRLDLLSLYIDSFETDPVFDDWGIYPSMKHLTFRCISTKPTFLFRLLQHCPNVETWSFHVHDVVQNTNPPPVALLAQILQEHCRKVTALELYGIYFINAMPSPEPGFLALSPEPGFLALFQATNNLVTLHLTMDDDFSTVMCDALLQGSAHSLEDLALDIFYKLATEATEESIASAGKLLSACPQLRHLHIMFSKHPEYSRRTEEALTGPWIYSKLETITLRHTEEEHFQKCPPSCKDKKTSDETCPIEVAYASDIEKQGWKVQGSSYKFSHLTPILQNHRSVVLTAASGLQHVRVIDLGFRRYCRGGDDE